MQAPLGVADALNLALAVFSIALSAVAMWLSIHFYRLSNELSGHLQALAELKVSAKTTEATATQITSRAMDVLAGHLERRIAEAEMEGRLQVARGLERALAETPPEERREARVAATRAVTDAFAKLRTSAAPTAADYDWGPFVRRIDELQRKNAYLSVKWLDRTVFAGEPGMQEALQVAIEHEVVRTFRRENPNNPRFPTLCCELERRHPAVAEALGRRAPSPRDGP
ncbi:MAG TPA: hypothetical protein VHG91_14725 [Longimicrobium sp.]|nr:hypothetical protein [Longimicrobium sp.]